jgi:hypothetical protein
MQHLEKVESKDDCKHIIFLEFNEFKQLTAQKNDLDPLNVLRV